MDSKPLNLNQILSLLAAMPLGQQILLGLFAATWIVGVNVLLMFHHNRIGKRWYETFTNPSWPFKGFNKLEWATLIILAVTSMVFGLAGVSYGR